ncbi:MAG: site-2 protease family protein [Clostridia bacterium]|nr:site-2 protease family protein [Clostridia bacterium]
MSSLILASFSEVAGYIGYILLAVLVLLVMITVHELGHYIAGKIFGFGIEEFAIGFGPKLFKRKNKKTGEIFSVRLFPIGGFCAFKGEDKDDDDPTAFNNRKPWQRIIVLISGAFMNYLLALLIIATMFFSYGQTMLIAYNTEHSADPIYTVENSFQDRDIIFTANGKNVYLITDLMNSTADKKAGDTVRFTVMRNGQMKTIDLLLRADTDYKNVEDLSPLYTALGIQMKTDSQTGKITESGLYQTGVKFGFLQTLGKSVVYSFKVAGSIFTVLGQLINGSLGIGSLGGTVTTISVTATAIKVGGFRNLLNIASFIGVNLAVFNLLPIPALDGSRVVFTAIEWIRRKPLNRKVEGLIHAVGLVLIMAFAIFIDLQQCF